ncbi:chromate efflux transporter [Aceticella autotrophica]|uniref:Chromate efflux transporter n=1 Tax=Aceticella autotrophica TaxID=2755338 RepID=A0A975AV89_9THEO|nr:chromate efflux transporter [Aceticella autotrophica]QSZ27094.1 chromate efflux transporter [Aceticella autotrophica]
MDNENTRQVADDISIWKIFLTFLKIGFTAFGPAMMIETKKNIIKKLKWINEKEFFEGLALAQLIPGATFASLTIYIGYKLKGLLGATASFIGFILPSFLMMLLLSWLYFKYQNITIVTILFKGFGAIVLAIILNAVFDLAKTTVTNIPTILIAVTAFLISIYYNNIFLILFISTIMGIILIHPKASEVKEAALSEKTKIQWKDPLIIFIILILYFLSISFNHELLIMSIVFFKIGALVFGNGFTMIPLIQHDVVNIHHWLTLNQFTVGVALGQITPGPIVITSTFIGYKIMGFIGALAATLSIFLPSFLLVITIFGLYRKIKHLTWVTAGLNGLIASFVGLMSIFAINMGRHVLVDIINVILFIASFIALQFTKLDTKRVILFGMIIYLIIYLTQMI